MLTSDHCVEIEARGSGSVPAARPRRYCPVRGVDVVLGSATAWAPHSPRTSPGTTQHPTVYTSGHIT